MYLSRLQQLHIKDEGGIGRDGGRSPRLAVRQMRGDDQVALPADLHAVNTDIPATNDLAATEGEGEGLVALIKHSPIRFELPDVVHLDAVAPLRSRASAHHIVGNEHPLNILRPGSGISI